MKYIKHEMKNMSHYWFEESDVDILTQETEKMFVSVIVKKNHVLQFVKFMISSTSRTHVPDFLRPGTFVQMYIARVSVSL